MQMTPYLSFDGTCEDAFARYQRTLGATVGVTFRYAGRPMAAQVPADWQQKIMHGSITIAGQTVMGGDVPPGRYEAPKGFSLSLQIESTDDAERIFRELAEGGTIVLPIEQTFWAARFGMLVDRFGIPWMINCETPSGSAPNG